ncbi:MAG: tRNA-dihydrouridine synthase family protein [Saccharofermentanaceae bacterium]|nr:tRNA-dihydrouridine synthase family protein [Saccharofermentanaceae bacterium]
MKIYFAPLEGVTTYIFRNAFAEIYGHVDKYFAPFISPAENCPLTPRERKDIAPENNTGINLVPQILTCRSEHFIDAAKALAGFGYREINLNLGCPSGTVCAKGKGAGFLQDKEALQKFLSDIYSYAEKDGMKISVKTRLGYHDPEEFSSLMEIFNLFPISELIVHPRIRTDFYKGDVRKEYFTYALEHSKCPLVYNGNIFSVKDYADLTGVFARGGDPIKMDCKGDPAVLGARLDPVMLGRGLVSDPDLAGRLKSAGAGAGRHDDAAETDYAKFRRFHDTLYHEYRKVLSPDINVLHKMHELWTYWQVLFDGKEREIKRLMKAKKYEDYEAIVYPLLQAEERST